MLTDAVSALTAMKLGPMAERLKQWTDDPANAHRSHTDCVLALVDAQNQATATKRARGFLAKADLPPAIALADVHVSGARGLPVELLGNLATCDWIRLGHTVVITGESQAGKTHLAAALAREATLAKLSVAYWRTPELLAAAAVERDQGRWPSFAKRLDRVKLLVLDDFATERTDVAQGHLLRQLIDLRHRHGKATMVVSPNAVSDWDDYFEDATAADAIFGRLLERSRPIVLKRSPRTGPSKHSGTRAHRSAD